MNNLNSGTLPIPNTTQNSSKKLPNRVKVSAVIPTKNEAKNLQFVLPRIPDIVDEVIIVDGHSTDNTIEVALELRPDAIIVQQTGKGKGNALRSGFAHVTGDIIVMLDADGSTDPEEIPAFVGTLLSGADFAKGSRFMQGAGTDDMEFYRYLGNLGFVLMTRLLFGGQYTDLCYGYNAFWTYTLPLLNLDGDGFEIETMMNVRALQAGLTVAEVPSFEHNRIHGTSNLQTIPDGWRVLKTMFKEWFKKPHLRSMKKATDNDASVSFRYTMEELLNDTVKVAQQRPTLSKESFVEMSNNILTRYDELVNLQLECKACRQSQNRYRQYFNNIIENYMDNAMGVMA